MTLPFEVTQETERVMKLVAEGKRIKVIARELKIWVGRVSLTMSRVYRRLGLRSRRETLALMLQGVLPFPEITSSNGADLLSFTERHVVSLRARGFSTKQVASIMGASTKSIERHNSQIRARIGCIDTVELVYWAIAHQLAPAGLLLFEKDDDE